MIRPAARSTSMRSTPRCPRAACVRARQGRLQLRHANPAPPDTYVELYTVTTTTEVSRDEFAHLRQGDAARPRRRELSHSSSGAVRDHLGVRAVRAAAAGRVSGRRPRSAATACPVAVARRRSRSRDGACIVRGRRVSDGADVVHAGDAGRRASAGAGRGAARDHAAAAGVALSATASSCTPTSRSPRTARPCRRSSGPAMPRRPSSASSSSSCR